MRAPPGTGGKAPMHSLAGDKARMHSPEPTQPPGPPPISPEERILETKNRVQNRVQITIDRADLHRRTPSTIPYGGLSSRPSHTVGHIERGLRMCSGKREAEQKECIMMRFFVFSGAVRSARG